MISQITIKNFQSHKETTLVLHDGVNALVGLTGAGKSVVFKALDWLCRNRPLGDEPHSWWGGDTQVELLLDSGQRVGRIRKYEEKKGEWVKTDDLYYVDKKEFRAFGNGTPPQPVLDLLNLSDVNFAAQAAPSFLISNSSGEVARYLNKAAHLDVIDQALSNIASRLRGEKEDLTRAQTDLEDAQNQLQQYDWLPEADEKLTSLEKLQAKYDDLTAERRFLMVLHNDLGRTTLELKGLDKILSFSGEAEQLIALHNQIEQENKHWTDLNNIVLRIEETQKSIAKYAKLPMAEAEWKRLDILAKEEAELRNNSTKLNSLASEIDLTTISIGQVEKVQKALESEFNRLMPNVCPLCDGTGGKR